MHPTMEFWEDLSWFFLTVYRPDGTHVILTRNELSSIPTAHFQRIKEGMAREQMSAIYNAAGDWTALAFSDKNFSPYTAPQCMHRLARFVPLGTIITLENSHGMPCFNWRFNGNMVDVYDDFEGPPTRLKPFDPDLAWLDQIRTRFGPGPDMRQSERDASRELSFPGGSQGWSAFLAGRADGIEQAILFLEMDPYAPRSGYRKERIWKRLKRAKLSSTQPDRLEDVAIRYLHQRLRREFWEMEHFVRLRGSALFWRHMETLATIEISIPAYKAGWLLLQRENHCMRGVVGGTLYRAKNTHGSVPRLDFWP